MAEPVDFLIDILCRGGSASDCQSFVSGYPDPASQLVFFLFFPLVFLLIAIHILTGGISERTKDLKIQTLLSVAMFLFIVFQGWYHFFLNISKFWFIAVIILGGFWVLFNKMGPASGGGGGGGTRTLSGISNFAKGKVRRKLEGKEKGKKSQIEQTMENLEALLNTIEKETKNPTPGTNRADMLREYDNRKRTLCTLIDQYGDYGKADIGGIQYNVLKQEDQYFDKLKKLDARLKKISKS